MKQFFSSALGAFVGTIIGLFVVGIFVILLIFSAMSGLNTQTDDSITENSILYLKLKGQISDKIVTEDDFAELLGSTDSRTQLSDILRSIKSASKDNNILGIFIDCRGVEAGLASCTEIRNAIIKFKESGKWVYSYGDSYTQADYYISSVSDSIFINPEGMLDIHGLSANIPYFKKLLDKVGVEVQVFKVGKFKSAVEPYILTEISEENKKQNEHFLNNMWNNVSTEICTSRNIDVEQFKVMVDSVVAAQPADFLIEKGFVDTVSYAFDFIEKLKVLTKVEKGKNLKLVTPKKYANTLSKGQGDDEIVVLYAEGEINSQNPDGIIAKDMIDEILRAANDKNVKGLVMRVNSPGGSAFDSEQIWAALETFKKKNKPYAVSMGDYAASGGYYISSGADRIFAESNTLTGSIGIFGMMPNLQNLITDIGINVCEVSTNPNANFPSLNKPMNNIQKMRMQKMVERGYDLFTTRCATGRKMDIDSLKMIAEGRVWDGNSALKLGLVDEIGDMSKAIEWVAGKANIDKYKIKELPESKDAFTYYISKYLSEAFMNVLFGTKTDKIFDNKQYLENIINVYPIQTRMNMSLDF